MVLQGVLDSLSDAVQTKTWLLYTRVLRLVHNVTVARPLSYNVPQVGVLMALVYQLKVVDVGNFLLRKLISKILIIRKLISSFHRSKGDQSHIEDNFPQHPSYCGLLRPWQFLDQACIKQPLLTSQYAAERYLHLEKSLHHPIILSK
jgi:hypothetical protein